MVPTCHTPLFPHMSHAIVSDVSLRLFVCVQINCVILDEVDEALRPPHLESTGRILEEILKKKKPQLVFASATADTPVVRRTAFQLMEDGLILRLRAAEGSSVAKDGMPKTITHGVCVVPQQKQLETLAKLTRVKPIPKVLAFVNSPHRVKLVSRKLEESYGVSAAPLYGVQEREERVALMRALNEGRIKLLVSTEMGARGLDIAGLTHVVNLELPTDESHYVHRAGRCGRGGAEGTVSLAPDALPICGHTRVPLPILSHAMICLSPRCLTWSRRILPQSSVSWRPSWTSSSSRSSSTREASSKMREERRAPREAMRATRVWRRRGRYWVKEG